MSQDTKLYKILLTQSFYVSTSHIDIIKVLLFSFSICHYLPNTHTQIEEAFTTFLQLLASLPAMQRMASGLSSPSSDFSNSCILRNLAPLSNMCYIIHLFEDRFDRNISIHCIHIHISM